MQNLKYETDELIYETGRLTDVENRRVVAKGAGLGRGKFGEFGIGGCKVLYIEWITKSPV